MLSALAHREPAEVLAALDVLGALDAPRAAHYTDLLLATVGRRLVAEVKAMLDTKRYIPRTPWLREQYDLGVVAGREEGREQGREQGREAGREEGRAAGLASALRSVLAARGLRLNARRAAQLDACEDPRVLEGWIARAVTATSVDAIFDG